MAPIVYSKAFQESDAGVLDEMQYHQYYCNIYPDTLPLILNKECKTQYPLLKRLLSVTLENIPNT